MMRGSGATLLREMPSWGVYFGSYDIAKREIGRWAKINDHMVTMIAGAFAGICGWSCIYPVDVCKTRMQSVVGPHVTFREAFRQCRVEGALWRGFFATIVRAIPVNAATFLGYENVKSWCLLLSS